MRYNKKLKFKLKSTYFMKIAMLGQKGLPAIWGGVERHVEELSTRLTRQ